MATSLIALGSNLGDRREALDWACRRLDDSHTTRLLARSRWHETLPIGGPAGQDAFLNGAVLLDTTLEPLALFHRLKQIEQERGRLPAERWGPRVLDLDLLLYDRAVVSTPSLEVPHPRMAWRRFVLEPAAEIAGEMVHPPTGWTIAKLLDHLNDSMPYLAIAGPIGVGKTRLATALAGRVSGELIAEQFDADSLETFYADPAGNAWAVEIQFLEERARLLAADSPRWSVPARLWMSDFWFDQSLAYAEVWLAPEQTEEFVDRWRQARRGIAAPRLTVLLDASTETLVERIRQRGRRAEKHLSAAKLAAIRQTIRRLADQPGHGPILRIVHDETEQAISEVLSAVEAMK